MRHRSMLVYSNDMIYFMKQCIFALICFLDGILPRKGIPVLFFHSMDESGSVLSISRDKFVEFITYLYAQGYKTLYLGEFETYLASAKFRRNRILITFDDGYKNNVEAASLLQKLHFKVIIFVATQYIGRKNTFCAKEAPELEMMNAEDIRMLAGQGVEFGAHGHTHRNLPKLKREEIVYEITESKRILEGITGRKVAYFCYPRGKIGDVAVEELERQGFKLAFSAKTGIASKASHPYFLPRVPLNDMVTFLQFKALLSPWYATFRDVIK